MTTLQKQIRSLIERVSAPWMDVQPAWLGDLTGVVVTNTPGVYNARLINGKVVQVYNQARVPADWDLPVKIGRHKDTPHIWQIIEGRQAYTVPVAGGRIEYHHEQHEFGQPDTIWVDRKQIIRHTILVSDAAGFVVAVIGGEFPTTAGGIGLIANQLVDLSSYVGTVGAAYVSIETDDDGVLSTHAGTDFGAPAVGSETYVPIPAAGKQMVGYVLIYDGQEELLDEHIRVPMPLITNPFNMATGKQIHDAAAETTVADGDEWGFWDISANLLKKITWSNIKTTLGSVFAALTHTHPAAEITGQYRQFVWVDDGAGGWEFVSSGGEPVFNLEDLE